MVLGGKVKVVFSNATDVHICPTTPHHQSISQFCRVASVITRDAIQWEWGRGERGTSDRFVGLKRWDS